MGFNAIISILRRERQARFYGQKRRRPCEDRGRNWRDMTNANGH